MPRLHDEDIKTREVLNWKGVHLIHFSMSSCSQKLRIFLNLKGIDWVSHHLDLTKQLNTEPWFLGINPRGLVPVLVHDGAVYIESNDILEYLEKTFPEPVLNPKNEHKLIIEGLKQEDDMHMDIRNLTMRFVMPRFMMKKKPEVIQKLVDDMGTVEGQKDPHKQIEIDWWTNYNAKGVLDEQIMESAGKFNDVYRAFDQTLSETPYLTGAEITLLDIAWFIYTHRLMAANYPFQRLHPNVYKWYQGLLAREEFSKEVSSPTPIKLITGVLHTVQSLKGATLEKVAGL